MKKIFLLLLIFVYVTCGCAKKNDFALDLSYEEYINLISNEINVLSPDQCEALLFDETYRVIEKSWFTIKEKYEESVNFFE